MKLPVVLVVLNNQILGYQKHAELSLFGNFTERLRLRGRRPRAIARACGCAGQRVERPEDLGPALRRRWRRTA